MHLVVWYINNQRKPMYQTTTVPNIKYTQPMYQITIITYNATNVLCNQKVHWLSGTMAVWYIGCLVHWLYGTLAVRYIVYMLNCFDYIGCMVHQYIV